MQLFLKAKEINIKLFHALRAAENCSDIMNYYYDKEYEYRYENAEYNLNSYEKIEYDPGSIKLKIDKYCNQIAEQYLRIMYPEFGFVGEESFFPSNLDIDKEFWWCVDPICGSKGYLEKNDHFGTSIALIKKGFGPILGVMNCPKLNMKGIADLENKKIFYESNLKPKKEDGLKIIISSNQKKQRFFYLIEKMLEELNPIDVKYETSIPSKSLKILTGIYDLHFNLPNIYGGSSPKIWDLASSQVFFELENMKFTNFYGEKLNFCNFNKNEPDYHKFKHGFIMAKNEEIHEKCIEVFKKIEKKFRKDFL